MQINLTNVHEYESTKFLRNDNHFLVFENCSQKLHHVVDREQVDNRAQLNVNGQPVGTHRWPKQVM